MAVGFPKKRIRKPLHAFSVAIPGQERCRCTVPSAACVVASSGPQQRTDRATECVQAQLGGRCKRCIITYVASQILHGWISERSRTRPAPVTQRMACTSQAAKATLMRTSNSMASTRSPGQDQQAAGGGVQRALRLLHGAEDLGDPHPLLGQLELLRPGDVVRPLGVRRDGAADQPLHRLVLARRRRRHREHERAAVLGLQLRHAMLKASAETERRRRMRVYIYTSLEVPVQRRRPCAVIPIRSHRASASSMECAGSRRRRHTSHDFNFQGQLKKVIIIYGSS